MEKNIKYRGIDFVVNYEHEPEEKEVRYYSDGSGYPGYPEIYEIESITHKDTDFMIFFNDKDIEAIENLLKINEY